MPAWPKNAHNNVRHWLRSSFSFTQISGTIPTTFGSLTGITSLCVCRGDASAPRGAQRMLFLQGPILQSAFRLDSGHHGQYDCDGRSVRARRLRSPHYCTPLRRLSLHLWSQSVAVQHAKWNNTSVIKPHDSAPIHVRPLPQAVGPCVSATDVGLAR